MRLTSPGFEPPGLDVIDPLSYPAWNEHLLAAQQGSIFHTTNWLRVLQESYGYRPCYFVCFNEGRLDVLLPFMEVRSWLTGTRGVSLPFSDYCPLIIQEKTRFPKLLDQIITKARQRRWKFVELRGADEFLPAASPWICYYRHILILNGSEAQTFDKLRSNYRAKIKKAHQNNVTVEILRSPEAMSTYYHLHCLTRKRHGLPPQPASFFKKVHEHVISQNLGFVILASNQGKYVSGAVFFHFGKRAIYKFGAMDMSYQHLNPNYLVFWNAIQWLCRNGYDELCFGKTASDNKGLIQFKVGWGTEKVALNYYRYDTKPAAFIHNSKQNVEQGYYLFRKMPLSLLRLAGGALYPHVG